MDSYFYNTQLPSSFDWMFSDISIENFIFKISGGRDQWLEGSINKQDLADHDPFLKYIHTYVRGHTEFIFIKSPPNTIYNWHVDRANKYNFNYVFEQYNSKTLFRSLPEHSNVRDLHAFNFNFTEIEYIPKNWYLFNSQIAHTVINFDSRNRYLLQLSVKKSCEISYENMLEIIKRY
jgi:hypothetical protein